MVTQLVVRGLSGLHKLKVVADVHAGRITDLKIRDLQTKRIIGNYENHEWLINKIPLHHLEAIVQHIIENMV